MSQGALARWRRSEVAPQPPADAAGVQCEGGDDDQDGEHGSLLQMNRAATSRRRLVFSLVLRSCSLRWKYKSAGLIGEHRGADKIYHAIDKLDNAIRDIRDAVFAARTIDDVCHDGEPRIALYATSGESRAWRLPETHQGPVSRNAEPRGSREGSCRPNHGAATGLRRPTASTVPAGTRQPLAYHQGSGAGTDGYRAGARPADAARHSRGEKPQRQDGPRAWADR